MVILKVIIVNHSRLKPYNILMTRVHELIDDYDITGLIRYLYMKNVSDLDQPNSDGVYPIEYVVSCYDPEKHVMKTHCLLIQILLNKGFQMDKDLLNEIKEEQEGNVKEFIETVLKMKANQKKDRFARHENIVNRSSVEQRNNIRNNILMPKSNYSDTELLQLQQAAERNGVLTRPTNHLALRIINHLEKLLQDYGHYN